jgi:small subunit ribosomal protein S16
MVKIRLKRMGAKKSPFYRVVVADARTPRDGRPLAELGFYDPTKEPTLLKLDVDEAKQWLKNGAQATETVRTLFKRAGVLD